MIFIEKSIHEPDIPVYKEKKVTLPDSSKGTKAEKETSTAISFYGDSENFKDNKKITDKKDPSFKVYSDKKLKKELIKIFNGKCAYCESAVLTTAPGDIEHFRPKKKVVLPDRSEVIPGYYWLAADWQNLLLSCGNCNRTTKQRINDSDEEITMGKLSQFPLSDESKRVKSHLENISTENDYVLLINPCIDSPEEHLLFNDNGEVRAVKIDGHISSKGETSIQVYGLYRADLVLRRKESVNNLKFTILKLYENVQDLKFFENDEFVIDRIIERIKGNVNHLAMLFNDKAVYLAMKRQKLNRFINSEPEIYESLLDVNVDLKDLI